MRNGWSWAGLLLLLTVRVSVAPAASTPAPPAAPRGENSPAISGQLVSADSGKTLPGATVDVYAQLEPEAARLRHAAGEALGEPLVRGVCDRAGRFRISVPPSRRLIVVAQAAGHARSSLARPIVVAPTAERDLGRLELPAGRRLTGKVVDAAGKPVAGARVAAMASRRRAQRGGGPGFSRRMIGEGPMPPFPVTAAAGADGTFSLDALPEGAVTLRAWADKLAPALVEEVRAASMTIRLDSGHPLSGKVVAPDGRTPVAGAWVIPGDDGWDGLTRSGPDGTFRFDHLRKGPTTIGATVSAILVVAEDARTPPAAAGAFAPSAPLRVTLPAAAPTPAPTLRMRAGGLVRARAIDAQTRRPLAGAALTLNAPGEEEPRPATTGPSGEVLFTGVPAGTIRLRAEADGYLEAELGDSPLASGQTRAWSAALRPAAAIEGIVSDAAGRPVRGARVSVSGPPPFALPMRLPIYFPIGVDPAVTGANGRFALERLPSRDELKVGVEADGFAPWEMAGIKLRPGERRAGMEVLLDAGALITGRLMDGDGQPVAAASVAAVRRREGGPGGMVIRLDAGGGGGRPGGRGGPGARGGPGMADDELAPALTGADGVFRVRGARPGVWNVEITARGFAPKTVAGLKLEAQDTALDAGDIRLEPGAALRGRVVTPAGNPVPYARGTLRKEFSVVSTFDTGADGVFSAEDLAPGDLVTLAVDADGYAAVEKRGIAPPADDLVITLPPSSRVGGQVLDRETRRPIPDFSIALSRTRGGSGGGMTMNMAILGPETAFHTEDGAFLVEDVDPGKVAVAARAPGYRESTLRDLEVPEGKDLDGLIITLDRSASVSGTVLDDKGAPLPGAAVRKKETSGGMGMMIRGAGGGEAITDGDGAFTLSGLDQGPMTLSFEHRDFEAAERDIDTTRDVPDLRVTLTRGAALTGIVLREEDGSPVGGATVTAVAAGGDRFTGGKTATTGPDGTFSIDAVSSGRYALRAEATGLRTASIDDVVVAPGAPPPPCELRMGGGVTLSGTITGVKDEDLPLFAVRAVAAGSGGGGFGTTAPVDAAGHFEIKGLAAGTLTLIATSTSGIFGGKSATRTVQIPDNTASFETTLEFPHGSTVEGGITRGGKPIEGANVIFMNNATRARVTATADAAGHYVAEDLDDGEYSVDVVQFSSGISHATRLTVRGDRRFDIELPLARITGAIKDSGTSQPLEGATVSIKKENTAQPSAGGGFLFLQEARTDSTGAYAIEGLDQGSYTLTARKDGYGFETRAVTIAPTLQPDEVDFDLARVDAFAFRATDAGSGLALKSLSALVLVGGSGDPLAPNGSGATTVFRGQIAADATGLFRLDSLQPGSYRIVLGGQGIATETLDAVRVPGPEMTVAMVAGGSVEITAASLKPKETARAVLLDGQGHPVHVNTFLPEPSFLLRPGTPTTLGDLKPGSYRLRASMPGGVIAEAAVEVAAGRSAVIAIP